MNIIELLPLLVRELPDLERIQIVPKADTSNYRTRRAYMLDGEAQCYDRTKGLEAIALEATGPLDARALAKEVAAMCSRLLVGAPRNELTHLAIHERIDTWITPSGWNGRLYACVVVIGRPITHEPRMVGL